MYKKISNDLRNYASKDRAGKSKSFFKTAKGEYGEGDIFIGVTVPNVRKVAKMYKNSNEKTIERLLNSKIHEERLCGLIILVEQYQGSKLGDVKLKVVNSYLKNLKGVNNWDLVDLSCYKILGHYIFNYSKDYKVLYKFSKSKNLWKKRISIVSTFYFIKNRQCNHTLQISKILIPDNHDLTQKAVGWMLREVGKNCGEKILKDFLISNYDSISRTTLRYAIEKFNKKERIKFLQRSF